MKVVVRERRIRRMNTESLFGWAPPDDQAGIALAGVGLLLLLVLRSSFRRLPLHRDTGFYVPNHAVRHHALGTFRGWNSFFSGGSRALPQFAHTALYLAVGGDRYRSAFRWLYTLLAAVSLLLVVGVGSRLGSGWFPWVAFFFAIALFSETQYFTYFESAEAFETPLQLGGLYSILLGLDAGAPSACLVGLGLFWVDTVFVKLSSAPTTGS